MKSLNTLFDTSKPILLELASYAKGHDGEIPDHIFVQACTEYGVDEWKIMDLMQTSPPTGIQFTRGANSFYVTDNSSEE
jgi:hypothetical protein